METLPTWLTDAVVAAGMTTAYVEELDGKAEAKSKGRASAAQIPPPDFLPPALH